MNELLSLVYVDIAALNCGELPVCDYKERTLSFATGIVIPEPVEPPEISFNECCYVHVVLADLNTDKDIKNDYSAFYHQRQLSTESADYKLYKFSDASEYELNDDTYGTFFDFGYFSTNVNMKGYIVRWKKVLTELGEDSYKIIKTQNIAGVEVITESLVFTLKQYSDMYANTTCRIDIVMNGFLRKTGDDFTGLKWLHSIRVPSFFGDREPQYEEDVLIDRSYDTKQITITQTNEYKFQTNLIPECVTSEIYDFIIMSNEIYITDYNINNHSYKYKRFPVNYSGNDGTQYPVRTRKAELNLIFKDRFVGNKKESFR